MSAPGFWDDAERAAAVSAEHSAVSRRLESYRSLERDIDDLDTLEEMAAEDESIAAELEEQRESIEGRLAELEEARLFSGEYDGGDAVVTVNAGAGGTDSQDWAEMLLRMEMRWAERRGFKADLLEASAGEEAGIKSATFRVSGENAYGLYAADATAEPPPQVETRRLAEEEKVGRNDPCFCGSGKKFKHCHGK